MLRTLYNHVSESLDFTDTFRVEITAFRDVARTAVADCFHQVGLAFRNKFIPDVFPRLGCMAEDWELFVVETPSRFPTKLMLAGCVAFSIWRAARCVEWLVLRRAARDASWATKKGRQRIVDFVSYESWLTFGTIGDVRSWDAVVFMPSAPAGRRDRMYWTTTTDGLTVNTDTSIVVTQPPLPVNGTIKNMAGIWTFTTIRDGDYVYWKITHRVSWRGWICHTWAPFGPRFIGCPLYDVTDNIHGEWVTRRELEDAGLYWVARTGQYCSVPLTMEEECALQATLNTHGTKTVAHPISALLHAITPAARTDEMRALSAAMLADYWSVKWATTRNSHTRPAQALQDVDDRRADPLAPYKPTGWRIGPELCAVVDSAPMMGKNNDMVAVNDRVDKPRNTLPTVPRQYRDFAHEFARLVTGGRKLEPVDLDYVIEKQDGPLQKARNKMVEAWTHVLNLKKVVVSSMLKKEAIVNSGPVRNISTLPAEFNLALSRFTLVAAEYLKKNTGWYTAGLPPKKVAMRMVSFLEDKRTVIAADISKMDACKAAPLTAVVLVPLFEALFPYHADEITDLHFAEANATAVTSAGDAYAAAGTQLSGSATTTIHNTISNAWLSYCAHRLDGMPEEAAYAALGLYVGDDSVSACTPRSMEAVGHDLGYVIKAEVIRHGEPVPFLSRVFTDAWTGGTGSYQDPVRLLRKSHMSFGDPSRTIQQLACDKWTGYASLDPACSVYCAFKFNLERITGKTGMVNQTETPWYVREFAETWPSLYDHDAWFERETGIDPTSWIQWANKLATWEDWIKGPPLVVQNQAAPKRTTIDPTSALSIYIPPRNVPPPTFATLSNDPAATINRRAVQQAVHSQSKQMLTRRAQRDQARAAAYAARQPGTTFQLQTN